METNALLDQARLKTQYQDYLREIEHEQLCRQFTANRPKSQNRLWLKLVGGLISLARRLRVQRLPGSTFKA